MRKVQVFKYDAKAEDRRSFDFIGFFHQWGLELFEGSTEASSFTVAIVEDYNGKVHMVVPSYVQFL